jgi:hypothetical protein
MSSADRVSIKNCEGLSALAEDSLSPQSSALSPFESGGADGIRTRDLRRDRPAF